MSSSPYETDGKEKNAQVHLTVVDSSDTPSVQQDSSENDGVFKRFVDSFKEYERPPVVITDDMTELEKNIARSSAAPLSRKLKNRHLQMIAIGGAIGTGLFVGSGGALRRGGPAALLIGWILTGAMMFCTVQSLGELAVTFPVSGSFVQYNTRFISPAWGFCMAWNYALGWLTTLPLELVAASITIDYWNSDINSAAWVSIFYFLIFFINVFGVRGYGEAEFIFSIIKVLACLGFIFLGIILVCGGGPQGGYIGGKYWHDPGAFAHGFHGVCSVFVTAAFSFGGTELAGLAAAETENPRKTLPSATKQVFWRITLFYIVCLTLVGLLVPYTEPLLINSSGSNAAASPFVIAIKNAGIKGLPSVMNVVIMIAVISVGNSAVFGCSRTIASLADQGFGPKCFGYIDRQGRPLVGLAITLVIGLLCYLAASPKHGEVFTWLMAISGLSGLFTWWSINLCHLRFRRALSIRGRGTDELSFVSQVGIPGSLFGFCLIILILIAQLYVALFPIGGSPNAENFFEDYLTLPVLFLFIAIFYIWKRDFTLFRRAKDIDVDSGRKDFDLDAMRLEIAAEKAELASKPLYFRIYKFWC
ncbi:hypothetical protein B5S31_g4840 [[Candida] boidinii]|nr:hypothetical protein B5S31_g4840 [[Candida] boidinii]